MAASLGATPSFTSLSISSSSTSSSLNPLCLVKSSYTPLNLHISFPSPTLSHNSTISHLQSPSFKKFNFQLYCTVQELQQEEAVQEQQTSVEEKRRKLFVVNIPWSYSVTDMKNLFAECGTVSDVEIIKGEGGKHRGYAFVTMDSPDDALAVIKKFDSYELWGRIIKVEFAKSFKKPSPLPPVGVGETPHKLYVSNLAWKVRSSNLREFFAAELNPVSARVVFNRPAGGSAGYGFVSFATKEEAEAAIASMNGKELMGRPIQLKFSEKNVDGSGSKAKEESTPEGQSEEAEATQTQPEGQSEEAEATQKQPEESLSK